MKKRGAAWLVTIVLLAVFLLPGCVSMDQINTLEQEIASLQSEVSAASAKNQEFAAETSKYITKKELGEYQKVRDNLLNGLSEELQTARGELAVQVNKLANESDMQQLAERVASLEETSNQTNSVITQLMAYGGYKSSAEMMEFAYGLIDIYDSINAVQDRLQKLKEAMSLFVEE